MEKNKIIIIVLLSLLGCAIIGVGIYLIVIFTKKDGSNKKCLNGCQYKGESGNCGNRLVKKESVLTLVLICVLARKDGVNMINIWAGIQKWIAQFIYDFVIYKL